MSLHSKRIILFQLLIRINKSLFKFSLSEYRGTKTQSIHVTSCCFCTFVVSVFKTSIFKQSLRDYKLKVALWRCVLSTLKTPPFFREEASEGGGALVQRSLFGILTFFIKKYKRRCFFISIFFLLVVLLNRGKV